MRKIFREKSELDRKFWVNLKFQKIRIRKKIPNSIKKNYEKISNSQKSGSTEKSKFDKKNHGKISNSKKSGSVIIPKVDEKIQGKISNSKQS